MCVARCAASDTGELNLSAKRERAEYRGNGSEPSARSIISPLFGLQVLGCERFTLVTPQSALSAQVQEARMKLAAYETAT